MSMTSKLVNEHSLIYELIRGMMEVCGYLCIDLEVFKEVLKDLELSEVYGIMNWVPFSSIDYGLLWIISLNCKPSDIKYV